MEIQLRLKEKDVFANQRGVSYTSLSVPTQRPNCSGPVPCHTSNTVTSNSSHQTIDPIGMLLCLPHDNRMALLENLVDGNESLERLDLVGKNRLTVTRVEC